MLPIFSNLTWLIVMILALYYITKGMKRFDKYNVYMKVLYISALVHGLCLVDVLIINLSHSTKLIPSYFNIVVPVNLMVSFVAFFTNVFVEIKNSNKSEDEKRIEYKNNVKELVMIIIGFVFLYCNWSYKIVNFIAAIFGF